MEYLPDEDDFEALWIGICPTCGFENGGHFQRKGKKPPSEGGSPMGFPTCFNEKCPSKFCEWINTEDLEKADLAKTQDAADLNLGLALSFKLIDTSKWDEQYAYMPEQCRNIVDNPGDSDVPIGIGYDNDVGWFILGEGLLIIWQEKIS